MSSFTIGEEVLYRGERFAITTQAPLPPYQYRLVATTPQGVKVVWAQHEELGKMERYTTARDDTQRIQGTRKNR